VAEAAPVGFDCARGSLKAERALARIAIVAIDAMASILARHIKAVIDTVTTKFARPAYRATARVRRHAIHTRSPICTVMAETILNIFGAVIPLPAPITRTGVVVHEINADPVDARQRRTLIHVCLAVLSDKARDALACVGDKTVLAGAVTAAELAGASVNSVGTKCSFPTHCATARVVSDLIQTRGSIPTLMIYAFVYFQAAESLISICITRCRIVAQHIVRRRVELVANRAEQECLACRSGGFRWNRGGR
jgi:hypothetical protein